MGMAIRSWQAPLAAVAGWLCAVPLNGQFLLLDREMKNPAEPSRSMRLEGKPGSDFLADRFSVGAKGEVWVIDRLRMWGQAGGGRTGDQSGRACCRGGV